MSAASPSAGPPRPTRWCAGGSHPRLLYPNGPSRLPAPRLLRRRKPSSRVLAPPAEGASRDASAWAVRSRREVAAEVVIAGRDVCDVSVEVFVAERVACEADGGIAVATLGLGEGCRRVSATPSWSRLSASRRLASLGDTSVRGPPGLRRGQIAGAELALRANTEAAQVRVSRFPQHRFNTDKTVLHGARRHVVI